MSHSFNWKAFIYSISNNWVVPVIGNDLSMVRLPKNEFMASGMANVFKDSAIDEGDLIRINLYNYLAYKLWDLFGSGEAPSAYTLNKVVLQLQKQNVLENDINNAIKSVITKLRDDEIFLDPYRMLARIPGFDTILTVNLDNFMERAFEAEGLHINESINSSIPLPAIDQDKRSDKALPRIFNLMGNIRGYNYAVTEEQSLEYLYMLQNATDTMIKELFEAIRDKAILLIGCSFPDWFMRFFIRIIAKEPYKGGIKTKYVACDRTLQDIELSYFLQNNAIKIIRIGTHSTLGPGEDKVYRNSIEFIDALNAEWFGQTSVTRNQARFKEKLFLSYSWDDKAVVERLKNEFEKHGVQVFFDDDELKTGDRFNEVIKKYIKDCDYFLPIISNNAIQDKSRYVYAKEWRTAIVLNDYKDESYLRPYIIDDTPPTDARIPEEIRNINIEKVTVSNELEAVVRRFIAENKLTAIEA